MQFRSASVDLADVLATQELQRRPARSPDYKSENLAIAGLLRVMAVAPQKVFQQLVDVALELCREGTAGLSVLDESVESPVFRWPALAGQHAGYVGGTMPRFKSPCGVVLDTNAPQLFLNGGRLYPELDVSPPFCEALLIPFFIAGKAAGTLWVIATGPERHFDLEDLRILGSLAECASNAVQAANLGIQLQSRTEMEARASERAAVAEQYIGKLRALGVELNRAEQKERHRIAQVLHDDLQQLLVASRMSLDAAKFDLVGHAAERPVIHAIELVNQAIQASRTVTTDLYPPISHEKDLKVALWWLKDLFAKRHNLKVVLNIISCPPSLPEELTTMVFTAVRELLFNIVKHAGVKSADVSLEVEENGELRIVVADSGKGFDLSKVTTNNVSFGLFSIRERLSLLDGRMHIKSELGRGTQTTIWVKG